MINIALLGCTGSIGRQVLSVVDRYPEKFKIVSMAAGSNVALFTEQINKYKPEIACLSNSEKAIMITEIPKNTSVYYGENSIIHAVTEKADIVFNAVMGFAGMSGVVEAIKLKKTVCLANKETLVVGGELIMPMAKKAGVEIVPVDSEHSAIWQCLSFDKNKKFKKLIITASGGAFRDLPIEQLSRVTAQDALCHPTWQMGKKITIDCATMVNKGFEILEAMWLFNASIDDIDVVIHKQSIIHSMVEFDDGTIMSQMANPSMELPIQLALTYPERINTDIERLSLIGKNLTFEKVDRSRYPCFEIVKQAIKKGGVYPCAISGADEEAVKLFLNGKIAYTDIASYLDYALNNTKSVEVNFENLYYTDKMARRLVYELYEKRGGKC